MKFQYFIGFTLSLFLVGKAKDPFEFDIPCGVTEFQKSDRIVRGNVAAKGQFPWLVSLKVKQKGKLYHNCGGVIIHPHFVVSAAHCTFGWPADRVVVCASKFDMKYDEAGEQQREASKFYYHEYNEVNYESDIVLIKVKTPFKFIANQVVPVCLPKPGEQYSDKAVVAGWGRIKEDGILPRELQWVELSMMPTEDCKKIYSDMGYSVYVHKCQICTLEPKKDACQGDSGGPLLNHAIDNNRTVVQGVVSWGVGCARRNNPGVFTEILCFVDWITETVNKN